MEWLFGKQETPEQKMQREKMEMDMAKQAEEERVAQVETGVYANAPPAPRGYRAYGGPATYGNPASYGGKSRRNKSKGGTRKSKGGTRKGGRSRKTRKGGRRH